MEEDKILIGNGSQIGLVQKWEEKRTSECCKCMLLTHTHAKHAYLIPFPKLQLNFAFECQKRIVFTFNLAFFEKQ